MAYLDHAATTPMLPEAVEALTAQLSVTGNASSLHASGRRARRTVEEARETLAEALAARPSEVVFTSGGTEADNLAVKGLYWSRRDADPVRTRVLASPVEHHAVLDAVHWLGEHEGATVEYLPVDTYGRVHPEALREAIARNPDDVALATVMWANNEIGTVMPVRELADVAGEFGVPLHADAVQAFGQVPVDFGASGLAAMTVSGHKVGGPYGIGALLLGREYSPVPVLHGGGQERHVRSGTLDVPAIASFAVAGRLAAEQREWFAREIGALRDDLVDAVRGAVPEAILGGDPSGAGRLPANAHFTFPGCEGDSLLLLLDAQGIECSTGSACTAGVAQPSHVLLATGTDPDLARGTLRFSLGHTSTEADVEAVAKAIGPAVERARTAGLS
ncbi:cysteine desulfurase [Streptomyces avermitilis]|uniref:Pyridoxal-phosphate-dependent aminotransferase n=2 Tax=Streptomyces avermitilis TaxID=33903 RepID=Q82JJ9_STRAW|nr:MULTISPECIES: cysteine desulfurase family protein [Streptomyces]KUN51349.1 cysteine desulfurase [Streptomyces avermitilis]MYS98357.1 aminotransferase class V-fold PLP-dependent enzyme [Streptomyces sp. SID5469]OOV33243.1 cysteine desulfurase NifS [Streptomyces avermitilis]BAC70467.1 putative pyridoxal-phosphate-dependent aminotransferase [Streptomyces avermitilis MA-4680 = NBRC 14893]BBJ50570.1 cysteine desulfurase [Streptomyces avermitilis]